MSEKRKKFKIEDIKIQSFITELQPEIAKTAKGGKDSNSISIVSADPLTTNTISKAQSLWPYNNSTECTKITTTTTTTTTQLAL